MRIRLLAPMAIVVAIISAVVAMPKLGRHAGAWWVWLVEDGAYLSRRFATVHTVVVPESEQFRRLATDPSASDRRGVKPDFRAPLERQLTIQASVEEKSNYASFIGSYHDLLARHPEGPGDALATEIAALVHRTWRANRDRRTFDSRDWDGRPEWEKRFEDLTLSFTNLSTACGTIAQITAELMTDAGFSTRLLQLAKDPAKIEANHVLVEYYSARHGKWVMVDAMEDFTPRINNKPLSALEFFAAKDKSDIYKQMGKQYSYEYPLLWFSKNGPVMQMYYLPLTHEALTVANAKLNIGIEF